MALSKSIFNGILKNISALGTPEQWAWWAVIQQIWNILFFTHKKSQTKCLCEHLHKRKTDRG